jgi:DNA end-binding protein Ku
MAARSLWTGSITFGLVNIPVKLFAATKNNDIHFHLLHDQDRARLQRKMVCVADGKEVHSEHMVRGFQVAPDEYVVVRDEELEAISPKKSKTIEIEDFVSLDDIDPVYFDRPYYVVPTEQGAHAYRLLVEAMMQEKKVGIARFVMRSKEYLAALRPIDDALQLFTMRFKEEVLPAEQLDLPTKKADQREVKVATQLIESLTTEFKPDRYKDDYHDAVLELIEHKKKGEKITVKGEPAPKAPKSRNLLAALEASIAKAREAANPPRSTRRRKSA